MKRTIFLVLCGIIAMAARGTGFQPVGPEHGQVAHATPEHGQDAHATPEHGQDAHATSRPTGVQALLEQLGADDWRVRQAAQDKLIEMGLDVVPDLRNLLRATSDDEVRTRAEAAIRQIDEAERNGPTRITLHVKDASVMDVLAEISKQAKVRIDFSPNQPPNPPTKVSIDADRVSFWLVMKEICQKTGIGPSPNSYGISDQIPVTPGSTFAATPGEVNGCFYITPTRASRSHSIDYSNPQNASTYFSLQLSIYIDPKLKVVRSSYQLAIDEIVDEKGNSLSGPQAMNGSYSSGPSFKRDMQVPLTWTPQAGNKIARLKGSAEFVVLTKSDVWEIPNPLTAGSVTHDLPFGKCVIKGVSKLPDDQYQVQVAIENSAGLSPQALAIADFSAVQQSLRLVDANGHAWQQGGGSGGGGATSRSYQFNYMRNNGGNQAVGDPVKLIWEIPMEMKDLVLPVELRDLRLP
jgi:hypothetical protein